MTSSTPPPPLLDAAGRPLIGDRSYGFIPLRLNSSLPPSTPLSKSTIQILLIHQKTLSSRTFWCFPKGHPEPDDTSLLSTAIREFHEETGLVVQESDISFIDKKDDSEGGREGDGKEGEEGKEEGCFIERYENPLRKVGKEVKYWVAVLKGEEAEKEVNVQVKEVVEARWCGWEEGMGLITYEETKGMLRRVGKRLEGLEEGREGREGKI